MRLTTPAFDDGEPIPEQYGYEAKNVSPSLHVDGVPDEASSLALIMDDPDAEPIAGKIWTHWVVWNIPADTTTIAEGETPGGAVEGQTDYGESKYGGPNPPDGEHTYRFRLYALDTKLDLAAGSSESEVEAAMDGHVVAETLLTGTYTP